MAAVVRECPEQARRRSTALEGARRRSMAPGTRVLLTRCCSVTRRHRHVTFERPTGDVMRLTSLYGKSDA
jgi:hypothetical protein